MKLLSKFEYIEKKSKFIGYYYQVNSIEEVNLILEELKNEHKKARHMPYAYKIDNQIRKTDDKEPHNTAGTPLYNIIEKNNLNNCLIIVVRYFGGVLLGAGPLLRAYNYTAIETYKNATH